MGKPGVYRQGMIPNMIKVEESAPARLAQVAAEHGTTIGGYVSEFAGARRTQAEWEAIRQRSQEYLREHFGFDPAPQEQAELEAKHAAIMSDIDAQFASRQRGQTATV